MATRMEEDFAARVQERNIRLNKYMSEAGICSRREADRLIEAGRVQVDEKTAVPGMRVNAGQVILVDGKQIRQESEMLLLALNKPAGVVCTTDKRWGDVTVEELLGLSKRVFYAGRLDKDSEGLLLMTNNGDILNKIMRAGNFHEKEYEVTVNRPVTKRFVRQMSEGGILVADQLTRPCFVEQTGPRQFRIILTQGLNRQIRRMCAHFGYKVVRLVRVRIMNIRLGSLKSGEYREVSVREQEELYEMLKDSKNHIIQERKQTRHGCEDSSNERTD